MNMIMKPDYPIAFTNKFAKELLAYFGHTDFSDWNDNWCWSEICEKYKQYKKPFLKYLWSFHRSHDISKPLYYLWENNIINKSIVKSTIEKNKNGLCAYLMAVNCKIDKEWAEEVIENSKDGYYAYCMVMDCSSSPSWAEKVIEDAKDVYTAHHMVQEGYSRKVWYLNVKNSFEEEQNELSIGTR